jgi:hypothetical protein
MLLGKNKPLNPAKDEQYTPKWVFDKLGVTFDLDVCAPKDNIDHVPALNRYTEDSLEKEWTGLVWMNPPYSKVKPWVQKFLDHGNGIALLPYSKSKWFDKLWNVADGFASITPRLKFEHRDKGTQSIFMPCFLASMGSYCTDYLKASGINKVR